MAVFEGGGGLAPSPLIHGPPAIPPQVGPIPICSPAASVCASTSSFRGGIDKSAKSARVAHLIGSLNITSTLPLGFLYPYVSGALDELPSVFAFWGRVRDAVDCERREDCCIQRF